MTTSDFRLISGGRSNLIGKEISLSPSLPNRADCSPEVEFILNEERERERKRAPDEHGRIRTGIQFVLSSQLQSQIVLLVASRPYVFRLSLEIPRANLAFFILLPLFAPLGNETTDVQFGLETLGKREKVTRSS